MQGLLFNTLDALFTSAVSCGILGMGGLIVICFCLGASLATLLITLDIKRTIKRG